MKVMMVTVTSTLIGGVTSNETVEESDDSAEGKWLTTLVGEVEDESTGQHPDPGRSLLLPLRVVLDQLQAGGQSVTIVNSSATQV